ncbi:MULTISPECIES: cell division protein FtsZ [Nitrosomonas]|jgi:cell division protein FtsZ|uniref:Cell division protein FtsZ n=1 Tax=Nitrosomonas oligotropha TaxID=42354 RepID=A0A1H8IWQ4_9PROT|nr:cell division protein FtsZ [Nitrosomonas oligotropha]MBK7490657.1 cell division protein FtsZ [Nitrosomonas sp.]MBP9100507.1 cell division protein FtsZ [Nitrosomonas sp.]PTQ73580.1 cell division protein FtsZ [Nitrosomonas oligotropha]TXI27083.1 MAG: cell division protein FtsZ [Nitrosomonas oligotropha]SDW11333.1 cell division protein FtsZ [Nitrosomonas oligotropha]
MFEIMNNETQEAVIKVVGVGGCGSNAVDHMIQNGMQGVEFISMNTDAQALKSNKAPTVLQLGTGITKGLGAGANPEIGREAALEDRDRIAELIQGADMLFITAGMGGGTGTGAAPVVAQVAKEMGILTVAVVSKPFAFEGKRLAAAKAGMEALSQHVDSLIVIPNDKLMMVLGNDISMLDAFKAANDVLYGAVAGIAEVINCPGLVNVDFADVRTVMSEMGMAMMGSAVAMGVDRARVAAERAVSSPLLEDISLSGARGILVNITASSSLKMREVHEVMSTIKDMTAEDATIIVGTVIDENMADNLRVTMVATGLGSLVSQSQNSPLTVVHTRTGTDDRDSVFSTEEPAVMRTGRRSNATVAAMRQSGVDPMDIPAFLRRQAD